LRFDPNFDYPRKYSADENCPINSLTWFDAIRYCRWLSEQEAIDEDQMCYPPLEKLDATIKQMQADSSVTLSFPPDFLKRTGYRLPTEAEWEFLCRAGTVTCRYYGCSRELLPNYAYTAQNSDYRSQPVGRLFPNAFGLFDTLGNAYEWCHDIGDGLPYNPPPFGGDGLVDQPSAGPFTIDARYVMRGGSFLYQPSNARAAHRDWQFAHRRSPFLGFRVVRTIEVHDVN